MAVDSCHVRTLTKALYLSGVLNIALGSLFFYWVISERPPTPYFELRPASNEEQQKPLAVDRSAVEVINYFKTLPMEQLIARLSNTNLIENGFSQRDLALACLVTFHYFDLSRALIGHAQPSQHRAIVYGVRKDGQPAKIVAYPELSEEQFQAIIQFAAIEKWPLTARGLFFALKNPSYQQNNDLRDAFFLTPEFLSVEILFNRSEVQMEKDQLLTILLEGNWSMLSAFAEQQKQTQDLSAARRQLFLLQFIEKGSKAAAYAMLKTDGPFAIRKIDDAHVKAMLSLLTEKTYESERFALALLISPRGDAVWKQAAERLYDYAGEPRPEALDHRLALSRFMPKSLMIQQPKEPISPPEMIASTIALPTPKAKAPVITSIAGFKPAPATKSGAVEKKIVASSSPNVVKPTSAVKNDKIYTVQEGDSLWRISKRFKVDVELLKRYNHLSSDFLKPGTNLRIP